LSLKAPSISGNAGRDPWYDRTSLTLFAASYIQEADPLDPAVSPIYADLSNLPPTFVTAAANEALRDDAVRLVADACAAGANAVLRLVDDTVPSFVLFKSLPEASAVVDDFGGFVRTALRESDHSKAAN
jgi:acetyl esterase/lipase